MEQFLFWFQPNAYQLTFHLPLHRYLATFIETGITYHCMTLDDLPLTDKMLKMTFTHLLQIQVNSRIYIDIKLIGINLLFLARFNLCTGICDKHLVTFLHWNTTFIRFCPFFIGLFSRDLHLHVGPEWNSDQRTGHDLYSVSFLLLYGRCRPLLDAGKGYISQREYWSMHNKTVGPIWHRSLFAVSDF